VADVHTGDQQNECDGAEQHQQDRPNLSDQSLFQDDERGSIAFVCSRVLLRQVLHDRREICLSLFKGYSGLEPAYAVQPKSCSATLKSAVLPLSNRDIDVGAIQREARRDYSDDAVALVVERYA